MKSGGRVGVWPAGMLQARMVISTMHESRILFDLGMLFSLSIEASYELDGNSIKTHGLQPIKILLPLGYFNAYRIIISTLQWIRSLPAA